MNIFLSKWPDMQIRLFGTSLMCLLGAQAGFADSSVENILQPAVTVSQQQDQITITGTISDNMGPIAGVNVVEKGTTNGIITDMDGKFSLRVAKGAVLQVSYIGFVTQEIKVGSRTNINVKLIEDTQALDEVVVVGYGVQKKRM